MESHSHEEEPSTEPTENADLKSQVGGNDHAARDEEEFAPTTGKFERIL